MRLDGKVVDALVVAKKSVQGFKDPSQTFYSLGIVKDDETGELSCSKDVFDSVEKNVYYDFGFFYNQQYKSLQLDRVLSNNGSLFERLMGNNVPVEQAAAVPESAEEKKEESSATTKSSKK